MNVEGMLVALVTPFSNGEVDLGKLKELVDFQLQNGTRGFCPAATTGESPTLSDTEKASIIKTVVEMTRGKALVFPGTGTNSTKATVEATRMAHELGADGALVVTPYYNKPTQEGLFLHYEAVAGASPLPVILYNVPSRTGVSLEHETTARLSAIKNIVALKDASGSMEQVTQVRALCDINILSGEDSLTFGVLSHGGVGVISVAANVVPAAVNELCEAAKSNDWTRARGIHEKHYPLFKGLFLETNPTPVKVTLKKMGKGNGEVRLPLCGMTSANETKLDAILKDLKLI